jgi:hypothetical protein
LIWSTISKKYVEDFNKITQALIRKGGTDVDPLQKLNIFRYPNATYLTRTTFSEIGVMLINLKKKLVQGQVDDLDLRIAIDFLSVVKANHQALMVCQVPLEDLLWK